MQAGMGLKAPFLSAVFSMTHTHLEEVCVLPRPLGLLGASALAPGSRLFSGHQSCDQGRGVLPLGPLFPTGKIIWG